MILLKNSFNDKSIVNFISCINAIESNKHESINTLNFSKSIKNIKITQFEPHNTNKRKLFVDACTSPHKVSPLKHATQNVIIQDTSTDEIIQDNTSNELIQNITNKEISHDITRYEVIQNINDDGIIQHDHLNDSFII